MTPKSLPHLGVPKIRVTERTQDDSASLRRGEDASMEHKKRRNLHNARKTYVLAQAAPLSRTQRIFNITPKVLFQLQELSSLDRPQPVIDVVAAKVHAPKLSHGECLRMFKRRRAWRDSRIIVLKIDDYNTTQDHCSADTIEEALAVIVGWHRDNQEAEICFAGGSTWKATCFPNEVFEFVLETGTSNGFRPRNGNRLGGWTMASTSLQNRLLMAALLLKRDVSARFTNFSLTAHVSAVR
jgi:hypothetical protein